MRTQDRGVQWRRQVAALALVVFIGATAQRPLLAQISRSAEAELEACLSAGKILKGWEELIGLTKPLKVELECDGRKQKAVFKSLDVHKQGLYLLANGGREFNFSDCFKYERAAYLLDRELGLNMVPVAVLRRHQGVDGVLIAWIPNAVHEDQISSGLDGATVASLTRQRSIVNMFDSLIYNMDRRHPNILIDETQARMFMIDHTQAFREKKELQQEFAEGRVWLTEGIYQRLQSLDRRRLDELMDGLLTRGQLKTLLQRRDLILEKIDHDRQEYGDAAVFVAPEL